MLIHTSVGDVRVCLGKGCVCVYSVVYLFFVNFFWGHIQGMSKFPGQGSNPPWSCGLNHSYGNTGYLTHGPTRELPIGASYYRCMGGGDTYLRVPVGLTVLCVPACEHVCVCRPTNVCALVNLCDLW